MFTRSRGALELARDLGLPWALTYLFVVVPDRSATWSTTWWPGTGTAGSG
ncbi:MAG: hypothetical protein R2810_13330 [Flavobacteriales bacterium]